MSHAHTKGYLLEVANKPKIEGWLKDLIVKIVNNNGVLQDNNLANTINKKKY